MRNTLSSLLETQLFKCRNFFSNFPRQTILIPLAAAMRRRKSALSLSAIFMILTLTSILLITISTDHSGPSSNSNHESHNLSGRPRSSHRKLQVFGKCTSRDISISQSRDSTSGIPRYIVQIVSTCVLSSCAPSQIHLHCGWFASARLVNPSTFKRLSYDDCVVNGGKPLMPGQIIRFTYSNSFMYPLSFKSARFC